MKFTINKYYFKGWLIIWWFINNCFCSDADLKTAQAGLMERRKEFDEVLLNLRKKENIIEDVKAAQAKLESLTERVKDGQMRFYELELLLVEKCTSFTLFLLFIVISFRMRQPWSNKK